MLEQGSWIAVCRQTPDGGDMDRMPASCGEVTLCVAPIFGNLARGFALSGKEWGMRAAWTKECS